MGKKRYKSSTTTRNLRTSTKLLAKYVGTFDTVSYPIEFHAQGRRFPDWRLGDRIADTAGAGTGGPPT